VNQAIQDKIGEIEKNIGELKELLKDQQYHSSTSTSLAGDDVKPQ